MKKTRKLLGMVLAFSMLISCLPCVASAASNGSCGDNVTWTLNDEGTLTISGTGEMWDYSGPNDIPWGSVVGDVKSIVIEDGVTYIGNNAFCWAIANMNGEINVKSISIPKSLKGLGSCTFAYIENVDTVYYNAEDCKFTGDSLNYAYNYFPRGKNLIIGKDVKKIGANVFYRAIGFNLNQNTYTNVKYEGSEEDWKNVTVEREGNEVLKFISFSDKPAEEKQIRIMINNKFLSTDQPPVLINDRTMVPLRAIFEALGATVDWNDTEKSVNAKKDDTSFYMQIGNNKITVNGNAVELDVPAQIVNDRTMVPVRAVAEAFDCEVSWNGYQKYVIITPSGQQPYKIEAVNDKDEVLATAHFNDKGQLTNINGSVWFMPLLANINGNCYMDVFWERPNSAVISYDGNNVSEIAVNSSYDYGYTFNYNSDNTIQGSSYYSESGSAPVKNRTYTDNKIFYRKADFGNSDLMISFTLNNMGLAERYDMSESGGSGSLTYDSNGNLTHWTAFFGIDYVYDAQNKLSQASLKELSDPIGTSVTYRYTNE